MSIATLLSQHHQVTAVDIIPEKVDMINNRKGRYDAEKNAVIISLEKDEQSALSPQKCTT